MKRKNQDAFAEETRQFLKKWGLRNKFVCGVCGIGETEFSSFLHETGTLSNEKLDRLMSYQADYVRRNS